MKKTRSILCMSEDLEQKVYDQCNELNIKNKDISTTEFGQYQLVQIYTTKKNFMQIAFKVGVSKAYI